MKKIVLALIGIIILITFSLQTAQSVDIASVKTKIRKVNGEKLIDVFFDVSDNDPAGSDISLVFSLDNGKSFKIEPSSKELEGDFGKVMGNGVKTITWHPEKTCKDSAGIYDCQAEVRVPTGKPSWVLLNIDAFGSTEWKFPNAPIGKVQLNSLIKTTTFKPSGGCAAERGNWSTSVDAGAIFYTGATTGFPNYNANQNYAGPPTGPGCSNFFAVSKAGTKDEAIWINFSNALKRKHPTLDVWTDWDVEIRYNLNKAKGIETIVIGTVNNNQSWGELGSITKYSVDIHYDSATVSEKSDVFKLKLLKKEFIFKGKDGVDYLKFKVDDSKDDINTDSGWGPGSLPNTIKFENGSVKINSYLGFSGKYFQIDTTIGLGTLDMDGKLYITPASWMKSDTFDIIRGRLVFDLPTASPFFGFAFNKTVAAALSLTANAMMQVSGFSVVPEKFTFIGGLDAVGVNLGGKIYISKLAGKCITDEAKATSDDYGKIDITDLSISTNGVALNATVSSLGCIPRFCMTNIHFVYDNIKDSISLDGGFKYLDPTGQKPWFSGNYGLGSNKKGINWIKFGFSLEKPITIPYPEPPVAAFKGMGFDIKGLQDPNWDWTLTGIFTNPSIQVGSTLWGDGTYWEGTFSGRWKWPNIWEISADAIKMINLKNLGGWQGMATAKIALDLNQSITIDGSYNWCNWEGDQWIFKAYGGLRLSWNKSDMFFSGKMGGTVTIPAVLKSYFMGDLINNYFGLPMVLADIQAQFLNSRFGFQATFPKLGTKAVMFDMSKSFLDTKFMTFPDALNMFKTLRINDVPAIVLFPDNNDMNSVSAVLPAGYKENQKTLGNDTTWVQFTADASMDRIIAKVFGLTLPASVIKTPSGKIIDKTTPDSSVIYSIGLVDQTRAYWTLVNPAAGYWKVGIVNPKATDSVMVQGFAKPKTGFAINSTSKNKEITVSWDKTVSTPTADVYLYLDNDTTGYNGIIMGKVKESDGIFKYVMSDSLSECGYYVYAIRWDNDVSSRSYSLTYHNNQKSILMAPQNIKAVSNNAGQTSITWTPVNDPTIAGFRIRVTESNGNFTETNTINVTQYPGSFNLQVDNQNIKKISIVSIDENGISGCWSEQIDIVTGLQEEKPQTGILYGLDFSIIPNPASNNTEIRINLPDYGNVKLYVTDLLGNKVATLADGIYEYGTFKTILNTDKMNSGTYFVRLVTNNNVTSKMLMIVK